MPAEVELKAGNPPCEQRSSKQSKWSSSAVKAAEVRGDGSLNTLLLKLLLLLSGKWVRALDPPLCIYY